MATSFNKPTELVVFKRMLLLSFILRGFPNIVEVLQALCHWLHVL